MSEKTSPLAPQDRRAKQGPKKIATAATWGSKKQKSTFELELPSGETVLLKRVDMPTLLASGAFPDSLMSIVSEKIKSATGKDDTPTALDPAVVKNVLADPAKLAELFDSIDKIVPLVVAEPTVRNHKRPVFDAQEKPTGTFETIPDDERDEDVVYTDVVDLEDKMFIFQFTVGGTREVEDFRAELGSTVADVSAN